MERERLKRFDEEEDMLARSTKKFKESHHLAWEKEDNHIIKLGIYKDKFGGQSLGHLRKPLGLIA